MAIIIMLAIFGGMINQNMCFISQQLMAKLGPPSSNNFYHNQQKYPEIIFHKIQKLEREVVWIKKIVLYASNLSQRGSLACPEVGHVFNWVQTTTKFKKIIPYKSLYNEKTFLFYGIEMMIERADQGFLFGSSLLTSEPPPLEKRTGKT